MIYYLLSVRKRHIVNRQRIISACCIVVCKCYRNVIACCNLVKQSPFFIIMEQEEISIGFLHPNQFTAVIKVVNHIISGLHCVSGMYGDSLNCIWGCRVRKRNRLRFILFCQSYMFSQTGNIGVSIFLELIKCTAAISENQNTFFQAAVFSQL